MLAVTWTGRERTSRHGRKPKMRLIRSLRDRRWIEFILALFAVQKWRLMCMYLSNETMPTIAIICSFPILNLVLF